MTYLYPKDLAEYVHWGWHRAEMPDEKDPDCLAHRQHVEAPDLSVLENLLSTCYQASLMTHEGDSVAFRLIVAEPDEFDDATGPPEGVQKLEFSDSFPLTATELRRLSPAARYSRSMIGVHLDPSGGPVVWGIIHTGPRWLHSNHGGRGTVPDLPSRLVIKVMGAGNIEVSKGNEPLVSLSNGKFHGNTLNVFKSKWLHDYFAAIRTERQEIHRKAKEAAGEPWSELDQELSRRIDQYMLKRVIAAMRAFRHGGTLIIAPAMQAGILSQSNPHLTMKYKFADQRSRARFAALTLSVMNTMAVLPGDTKRIVGWDDYRQTTDSTIKALDEAIFEMSHLVSSLSLADGAVVLTRDFEILGFGAEIHCEGCEVTSLARALDLEGDRWRPESILGVGTRHRSAYRLCQQIPEALAIVVSQEGSVQFIRRCDDRLMFWDHQGSFDVSANP